MNMKLKWDLENRQVKSIYSLHILSIHIKRPLNMVINISDIANVQKFYDNNSPYKIQA